MKCVRHIPAKIAFLTYLCSETASTRTKTAGNNTDFIITNFLSYRNIYSPIQAAQVYLKRCPMCSVKRSNEPQIQKCHHLNRLQGHQRRRQERAACFRAKSRRLLSLSRVCKTPSSISKSTQNPHTQSQQKSSPSINTLTTDQALHPVQNPSPQPPAPIRSKATTSTQAARSHHSLFSHLKPQLQLLPVSLTRSRSQNSRHPATCPTRPITPKTKSTGQSSLPLCLDRILTAAPAVASETHRRPRTKRELGTLRSTGGSGCRSSSQLLTHCVTRGRYRMRLVWKRNTTL